MATMDLALKIEGLSKQFGSVRAVTKLYLSIPRGSVFGLLGPNGSGKSTTLGMILGIVQPNEGSFSWYAQNGGHLSRDQIGSLLEQPNFYPYLTARQNLKLVSVIKGLDGSNVDELLELVGLRKRADSKYKTFSTGMKQRLALASTLLADPEIVVLDEPTNGMDPKGIIEIRELIVRVGNSGKTVILASHLLDEVEKVCTHVAVLKQGILLESRALNALADVRKHYQVAAIDLKKLLVNVDPNVFRVLQWNSDESALVETDWDGSQLNAYLFEKGIVLNELHQVRESLESQFLQITEQ